VAETVLAEANRTLIQGGSFLIEQRLPDEVFTPEDLSDQHRLIAQTAQEFVDREVVPRLKEIEEKTPGLLRELLTKAAELGLCATDVAPEYGGLGLDRITSIIISEKMARDGAWAATVGAQAGIGILPIAFFGTSEQKQKYLPRLARGELVGAYSLSEASSGSDALRCNARATLAPGGKHYMLDGVKMWVTNGGIADLYIVFARVDGEKFTAFIVERAFPGVTPGAEEHKMGIRGSSTTALNLDHVAVPAENVLGEIGKGHQIAFNILNMGRLKLGAGCIGGCKMIMKPAIQWAKERQAFGRPIAEFGLIKEKLGGMVASIYAGESMAYRTAGLMDRLLGDDAVSEESRSSKILESLQEYAVECSMLKVMATEALGDVVDETVQIFGGYGFTVDYEIERTYRDQRVNRIFEGTNEINRLLIVDMLLKRSMQGRLGLIPAAMKLMDQAISSGHAVESGDAPLAREAEVVDAAKRTALFMAGSAVQRFQQALADEQEVVAGLANLVTEVYGMESALLRAQKQLARSGSTVAAHADAASCVIQEGADRMEAEARRLLPRLAEGDTLRAQGALLRRFLKRDPADMIELRRRLAAHALDRGRYPFE
jgi:alkylation response protein AidB-like acyl-CoA dehydrogenase